MTKKEARAYALNLRKNENKVISSICVLDEIIESKILDRFNKIGIYYPIGKEMNITELLIKYPDKSFYLPITKDELSFALYDDNLVDGPFNTKEPTTNPINRELIECFIIPCVAISCSNQRVGYGKGYYDRYLEGYKGYKIGICYKNAVNLDIECDEYDVKLDMIFLG